MRWMLIASVTFATQAIAGGPSVETHFYECQETEVARDSVVLAKQPEDPTWRVCMIYDPAIDGLEPGSVAVTLRDTTQPQDSPHVLYEIIQGLTPSSTGTRSESCIDLEIEANEVLAAVQTSGKKDGRFVRVCSTVDN